MAVIGCRRTKHLYSQSTKRSPVFRESSRLFGVKGPERAMQPGYITLLISRGDFVSGPRQPPHRPLNQIAAGSFIALCAKYKRNGSCLETIDKVSRDC